MAAMHQAPFAGREPENVFVSENWIAVDRRLSGTFDPISLLEANELLPGSAKFAWDAAGATHLRDEAPRIDEETLDGQVDRLLLGIEDAISFLKGAVRPPYVPSELTALDLPTLCAEHGWPLVERDAGRWMVELEAPPHFCQAEVTRGDLGFDLRVSLGNLQANQEVCSEAIGIMLLLAAGSYRMVRLALVADGGATQIQLLARVSLSRAHHDLTHALGSASVAARRLRAEIQSLHDPDIAAQYLVMVRPATTHAHNPTRLVSGRQGK